MSSSNTQITGYLKSYAEPEANLAGQLYRRQDAVYRHVLCLPCFNEHPNDIERFVQLCKQNRALLLLIINEPDNSSCASSNNISSNNISSDNNDCLDWINNHFRLLNRTAHLSLFSLGAGSDLLLIERTFNSEPLPVKQGVGLARKILSDIAIELISQGVIASDWIHCTDADTFLPAEYFTCSSEVEHHHTAALLYPYQHIAPQDATEPLAQASALYEKSLYHYVDGLQFSRSPYAFHTLGSTLCLNAKYLAIVRGFPKRAGGEDFYLLNKLVKVGHVVSLNTPPLEIKVRESDRVPFGTGPAVKKIIDQADPNEGRHKEFNHELYKQKQFYHPALFLLLRRVIQSFTLISRSISSGTTHPLDWQHLIRAKTTNYHGNLDELRALEQLCNEHITLAITILESLGFQQCINHCLAQCRSPEQALQHLHSWFDAFRTLRFFHLLREQSSELQNLSLKNVQNLRFESAL